jgi:hypothetical protein
MFAGLPPSSSLAEERTPPLAPCALLAPLAEAGAWVAAAFLTRSQTKNVSARSLVQDSGAPAWLRAPARDFRCSQLSAPIALAGRVRLAKIDIDDLSAGCQ